MMQPIAIRFRRSGVVSFAPVAFQKRMTSGVPTMISNGLIDWNQVAGISKPLPRSGTDRSVKSRTHKAMTFPLCS